MLVIEPEPIEYQPSFVTTSVKNILHDEKQINGGYVVAISTPVNRLFHSSCKTGLVYDNMRFTLLKMEWKMLDCFHNVHDILACTKHEMVINNKLSQRYTYCP